MTAKRIVAPVTSYCECARHARETSARADGYDLPSKIVRRLMPGDDYLHKYFLNNSSKRMHKWLHFFDIYEKHFERFRGTRPTRIEIGVFGGGSLEMWKSYFGEGFNIMGIDINPECKKHESEGMDDSIFLPRACGKTCRNRIHAHLRHAKAEFGLLPFLHGRGAR